MNISAGLGVMTIDSFQIAEPIKGLFQPRFEVQDTGQRMLYMKLTIKARDAYEPAKLIDVALTRRLERELFQRPDWLADFMRRMLHELVLHEIDESILWNGQRVFDPHRGEGQSLQTGV